MSWWWGSGLNIMRHFFYPNFLFLGFSERLPGLGLFFNPDKNAPKNNNNFVKKMRAEARFCFLVKSACFQ